MVTTTSSTTVTPTPTPTPSQSQVVSSAANSILTSLNSGSGVDTSSLVSSLVTAQFAAKASTLTTKADTLTAQISGVSTLKNAMSTFATALSTLASGGTLTTQPTSSNTGVLTATALTGAKLAGLSSSVTVSQLAAAQTAVSARSFASSSATVGTGTLTLTLGQATYNAAGTAMTGFTAGSTAPVSIDITDGSLSGIAKAINAAKAGVTAAVVTDADGTAYLSLKGASGKDQAFTLSATSTTGDLSQVAVGVGATASRMTSAAQNAKLTVDGVAVERPGNTIDDLIAGVKMQLTGVSTTAVTLGSETPTAALSNAVTDFVDTYNQVIALVKEQVDPITGPLKSDSAAKSLLTSLQGLTQKVLLPGAAAGSPSTLAGIGVRTKRDGTLEVDNTALTAAMKATPDAVEAMFAFSSDASAGLSAALNSLSLNTGSTVYGLGASSLRYLSAQGDVSEQQDALTDQKSAATTRLTAQFSNMNSKVAAYKSVQTFLTNQIAAWNKSE